jgi:hypothetical protein
MGGGTEVETKAHSKQRGSRAAFAAALITFVVGTFASFGGIGYAASGGVHAIRHLTHNSTVQTSSRDQYSKPKVAPTVAAVATTKTTPKAPVVVATKGQLPFTGLSLVPTAALGLLFIALGLMLRRREAKAASKD